MANREEILKQTQRFRHTLDAMEHVIKTGNTEALEALIRSASDARARLADELGDAAHASLSDARRARHVHDPLPRHPAARAASRGTVRVPGSKSISNRVLLLAALRRRHDDDRRTCSTPTTPA